MLETELVCLMLHFPFINSYIFLWVNCVNIFMLSRRKRKALKVSNGKHNDGSAATDDSTSQESQSSPEQS